MITRDSFGSLVIENQTLGDMGKLGGGSELWTVGASMNHEAGSCASLSVPGAEVGDDASGSDHSSVIQRDFNGYGAEEVVKEHSVADITPSRLEERMNMLRAPAPRYLTCPNNSTFWAKIGGSCPNSECAAITRHKVNF